MSDDPKYKRRKREAGTSSRIDLGDDLLEARSSPASKAYVPESRGFDDLDSAPVPRTIEELDDQFKSAKILRNEGLIEEAKKVLRRILIGDSRYKPARVLLEEIHEMELKQIFGEGEGSRRILTAGPSFASREQKQAELDAQEVARRLDGDFQLGIFNEEGMEVPLKGAPLFDDPREMEAFAQKLDRDLRNLGYADRIDIGIAFREMELFDLAIRQFRAVLKKRGQVESLVVEKDPTVNATCLLAQCLLDTGRPYEALTALQPALADQEPTKAQKVGLIYLTARAYETLGDLTEASRWYEEARAADPQYRDVEERARALKLKRKK